LVKRHAIHVLIFHQQKTYQDLLQTDATCDICSGD
jgi:hypothetical protein